MIYEPNMEVVCHRFFFLESVSHIQRGLGNRACFSEEKGNDLAYYHGSEISSI